MPTKDELVKGIDEMSKEITEAQLKLENEEAVELEGIETRIQSAMESIADLPPDDAIEMRPVLVGLLEKMEVFSNTLQEKIEEMHAEQTAADAEPPGGGSGDNPGDNN